MLTCQELQAERLARPGDARHARHSPVAYGVDRDAVDATNLAYVDL